MSLAAGTQFGPYTILSALGAGGMGEVYRARDLRLERDVAVKILPDHLTHDRDALQRFEREARAVAALSHPNILTVFDVGVHGGVTYLITELLEGETLRAALARSPLSPPKALEIGIAVADGLCAAQSKGIVHRDVKPENIFLTSDGRVKLLDFGLARRESDPLSEAASTVTGTGAIMGTLGYMSPEHVRGAAADARSDIFAAGCVLYEMISGKAPFKRDTVAESLAAVLRDYPLPLAQTGPTATPELERIILHCLEKNPEQRFQSACDLAFALKALAIPSAPVPVGAPPSRVSRRYLIGGASAALMGATGAAWYWRGPHSGQFDSLAVLPLLNATGDAGNEYLSDGISESIINRLSQTRLKVTARTTAFRFRKSDLDPVAVGNQLKVAAIMTGRVTRRGDNLVVQAELVNASDGTQIWGDRFVRPLAEIQVLQEEIAKDIAENLRLRLTQAEHTQLTRPDTTNPVAYRLYLQGRYYWNKFTQDGFDKAIECFNRAIELDSNYAQAYAGLSMAYSVLSADSVSPPKDVMPKARAAATRALALNEAAPEPHVSLAIYNTFYVWDWPSAERELRRALSLDPNNTDALHFYGHYLEITGRPDEAVSIMRRGVEIDPLSLIMNAEYAYAFYCAHRFDEAIETLHKTLGMDSGFIFASLMLAQVLERKGRFQEALAELERVRQQGWSAIVVELACAYAAAGQMQKARDTLTEVKRLAAREFVDPCLIAAAYVELHDREEAFRWLEIAYGDRSSQLAFINIEPKYDPVRTDPRFRDLLRRIKLA